MKKTNRKNIFISAMLLVAFVLWTVAIKLIDVRSIGPENSYVGFATLNKTVHSFFGVNISLYVITDWLGLVPVAFCLGFAVLGLLQLIKRRGIFKVDYSIIVLGGLYILVISAYLFFEAFVINYRPVLINGYLEASYPSSTTMLTLTVMITAIMQLRSRIKAKTLKTAITLIIALFTIFIVIGRALSGVHWITDIIGGILISLGLIFMYYYAHIAWKN